MSLHISHCAPAEDAPNGLHELARIRCCTHVQPSACSSQAWCLPLEVLDSSGQMNDQDEIWCVPDAVRSGVIQLHGGHIQQRISEHYAMYWMQLDLAKFENYRAATAYGWQQVLYSLHTPHPYLLKTWHYLPDINHGDGDSEHYRQFCCGREETLTQAGYKGQLPAATAIGIPHSGAGLVMYWLTSDHVGQNIENPRQVSAWEYPRDYGPSRPNFSRATLAIEDKVLLISGTASVVGHTTSHPANTDAQTREMLLNLKTLLNVSSADTAELSESDLNLRIYLRDKQDWPAVKQVLLSAGLSNEQLLPLHGHVCRQDLMVELDGYWMV